jgi:hypothetical protein
MSEPQSPPPLAEPAAPATSLVARMTNVFVAPGEVFDEVKSRPPRAFYWLGPLLISILTAVVFVWVVFSQEKLLRSVREPQEKAIQKQVDAGKMSQAQAQKAIDMMEKFMSPMLMKIIGTGGAVMGGFGMTFLMAVVVWLVGTKRFHGEFSIMQAVEMTCLAGMISALGTIVAMLLAVATGSMMATPGPVLLVKAFDEANRVHRLLSQLNVMTLWHVAVMALGLSRLSGVSWGRAAAWAFGIWALIVALAVLPGWGQ